MADRPADGAPSPHEVAEEYAPERIWLPWQQAQGLLAPRTGSSRGYLDGFGKDDCVEYVRVSSLRAVERERDTWKVRAEMPSWSGWPEVPVEHRRGSGRSGAYRHGFREAWRGVEFDNIYSRADCRFAYSAGFRDGTHAFARALSPGAATHHQEGHANG